MEKRAMKKEEEDKQCFLQLQILVLMSSYATKITLQQQAGYSTCNKN